MPVRRPEVGSYIDATLWRSASLYGSAFVSILQFPVLNLTIELLDVISMGDENAGLTTSAPSQAPSPKFKLFQ
jgi:hypothetical protein